MDLDTFIIAIFCWIENVFGYSCGMIDPGWPAVCLHPAW